jgi:RNAse (barnase) inhibitor barstar
MWPFDQPPNCATLTTRHVLQNNSPITRVVHDESDNGWQFLSADGANPEDAMLVCLSEIVAHDNTVVEVADLPPGWTATRSCVGSPWSCQQRYADATQVAVDWSQVNDVNAFYDRAFQQCRSPTWHGRNLDALADAWIAGGINENGPPYVFVFSSLSRTPPRMIQFRDAVLEIVRDSIDKNGGRLESEA